MSVHKSADIMPAKSVMPNVMSHILPSEVLIFRRILLFLQSCPVFISSPFFCVSAFCMLEKSVDSSPTVPQARSIHVQFSGFEMNQNVFSCLGNMLFHVPYYI